MDPRLTADHSRRLAHIVEACGRARSLTELIDAALGAIDEHLGHRKSAWILGLAGPNGELSTRAYGAVDHGIEPYVLEEYFERGWADTDPLASEPSRELFRRHRISSVAGLSGRLEPGQRRYVDDFLRRNRIRNQLSVWLDAGGVSHAYITLSRDNPPFDAPEVAGLLALSSQLSGLVRRHLPQGAWSPLAAKLSQRQKEVAELVTVGLSNRDIAQVLHVEEDTVKKHVSRTLDALGLERRTQLAVAWATGSPPIGTALRSSEARHA